MKQKNIIDFLAGTIAEIAKDERFRYKPADVSVNAPLALIQVDLKARHTLAGDALVLANQQQAVIDEMRAALISIDEMYRKPDGDLYSIDIDAVRAAIDKAKG